MPLRCLDLDGKSVYSLDFSDDEWQALVRENRKARHLRTPCCNSPLMLKRSRRGTPFFAHMKRGACATGPETEEHLELKRPPANIEAIVTVLAAETTCWHCRAKTRILTGIKVACGPNDHRLTVSDVWEHPEPLCAVLSHIPRNLNIGEIKPRFSQTVGSAYVSNGCVRCDRLMGAFFEHDVWNVEEPLCRFAITLSEQWRQAIVSHDGFDEWVKEWRVYPQTNSSRD